jgi:hypothetical protein
MNDTVPRRISNARVFLMIVIDLVAIALAVGLYLWLGPRDMNAAVIAAVSCLVFGAFFNLVIVLVSLKP